MSREEVKRFFEEIIFGYMCKDIEEQIERAKLLKQHRQREAPGDQSRNGGGNYLCALGLLSYTEFMGAIHCNSFQDRSKTLFNDFLYLMGEEYKVFDEKLDNKMSYRRSDRQLSVYEVFRCGLAHEYYLKGNSVIYMLSGTILVDGSGSIVDGRPGPSLLTIPYSFPPCGIGVLDDGRYFFVVEKYYEDFKLACSTVYEEIMDKSNPSIPTRDSGELLIPNHDDQGDSRI